MCKVPFCVLHFIFFFSVPSSFFLPLDWIPLLCSSLLRYKTFCCSTEGLDANSNHECLKKKLFSFFYETVTETTPSGGLHHVKRAAQGAARVGSQGREDMPSCGPMPQADWWEGWWHGVPTCL